MPTGSKGEKRQEARRLCTQAYFVLHSQTEGKKRADNEAVALATGGRRSF